LLQPRFELGRRTLHQPCFEIRRRVHLWHRPRQRLAIQPQRHTAALAVRGVLLEASQLVTFEHLQR
jgi:hypothetical protein